MFGHIQTDSILSIIYDGNWRETAARHYSTSNLRGKAFKLMWRFHLLLYDKMCTWAVNLLKLGTEEGLARLIYGEYKLTSKNMPIIYSNLQHQD